MDGTRYDQRQYPANVREHRCTGRSKTKSGSSYSSRICAIHMYKHTRSHVAKKSHESESSRHSEMNDNNWFSGTCCALLFLDLSGSARWTNVSTMVSCSFVDTARQRCRYARGSAQFANRSMDSTRLSQTCSLKIVAQGPKTSPLKLTLGHFRISTMLRSGKSTLQSQRLCCSMAKGMGRRSTAD
jgi:hypothetical protein